MLSEWNQAKSAPQGVSIEGVRINLPTLATAADEAVRRAERGEGFTLFTVNLDHLVKLASNDAFRAVYRRATYVTADGWPVVWLAGRKNAKLERATGADLVEPLCRAAAERNLGVYFVGPGPKAQVGALEKLTQRFQGLKIAGAEAPMLPAGNGPAMLAAMDLDAMAQRINASDARICFVSLGAPKQEILADALAARCPGVGFICVGAALDFISGQARRAPQWMQRGKLEWFWRLANDPRRLAVRYAECAMLFAVLALGVAAAQVNSPVTAAEPRGVLR
ncbi:WecB/TagA/CpsF family glycosyltransferase [Caulobacter sp. ErkDOM-E]|uniref:WecB/TagA/CpsF family glycosyltransferase n=1 Tax=Caulobacter sp. ErkDOM-E TaxID=3402778 RepID=UPI003AF43A44